MSRNDTWMPLYLGDYLADTMHLNGAQHGAYLLLLMHYWRNGPLPADDAQLATIAKTEPKAWRLVGPVVKSFFTVNGDGRMHQKRMDHERIKWSDISDKRKIAGKAGADAKWKANGGEPPDKPGGKPMANAMANHLANGEHKPEVCHDSANTPLPSPVPKERNLDSFPVAARARDPDPPPECAATSAAFDGVVTALRQSMRPTGAFVDARKPIRDAQDQIAAVAPTPRPKPSHLSPDQLAAARRRAG